MTADSHDEMRCSVSGIGLFIFLLALAIRAIFLFQHRANPTFELPIVDALTYHQLAAELAAGNGFGEKFFWQSFFHPLFLGGVYRVFGVAALPARLLQILLGAGTCVLAWGLGRRLVSERVGLLAGLMVAFYGPLIAQEGELLPTTWEAFWLTAWLFLLVSRRAGIFHDVLVGLAAALLVLTRAVFLPFVLVAGIWEIWKRGGQHAWRRGMLQGVAFVLPLLVVAALSYRETGHFSALPGSGGFNFYLGNNPRSAVTESMRPGDDAMRIYRMAAEAGVADRRGTSGYFYKESVRYIREQPIHFLKGLARKTAQLFSSREIPRNLDVYLYRRWSSVLRVLVWKCGGFGFPFGLLGPLALLGLIAERKRWPAPLVMCVVVGPVTIVFFIAAGRYRVPMIPVFAVLAAAGMTSLLDAGRRRDLKTLAVSLLAVIAVGVGICFPREFAVERTDFEAELDYCAAGTLLEFGRPEEAAERLRAALQRRPDYLEARFNYGVALAQRGRVDKAVEQWREVLRLDPDDPDALRALEEAMSLP